jgi:hypothetical protein
VEEHSTRDLLVHGATGFAMRGFDSVGPRGFVVKAPVEFDSMGPYWVVLWTPGWAQLREKGGETLLWSLAANWWSVLSKIGRCIGKSNGVVAQETLVHGDVDVKKSFSARTARREVYFPAPSK